MGSTIFLSIAIWACFAAIRYLWCVTKRWSAEPRKPKAPKVKPIPASTVDSLTKAANERYRRRLAAIQASMMQEDPKKHGCGSPNDSTSKTLMRS